MSARWFKFREIFVQEFRSGSPWIHTGIFVFVLSFLCVVGNTSFHIMGVDIGEFRSLFYGLIPSILRDLGVVLFVSYSFFFCFSILSIGPEWEAYRNGKKIPLLMFYPLLFAGLFLLFCSSVSMYPQVYGEFFYYRQAWALGFLYFLTDHIPPWFSLGVLSLLLSVQLGRKVRNFLKEGDIQSVVRLAVFLLFFYGFHRFGSALGVFFSGCAYYWSPSLKRRQYEFFLLFVLALGCFGAFQSSQSPLSEGNFRKNVPASVPSGLSYPNVLVLAADSIREDQLGFVQGKTELTPNIDLLAADSRVFLDHHTTIPRTFPAWADLLTGRYSFEHGILDMFPDKKDRASLGSRISTLAGILNSELGYRTGVVSSFAGDIFPRADWGFSKVYAPDFNAGTLTQQRTLESQVYLLPVLTGAFFGGGEYLSSVRSFPTLGDDERILPDLFRLLDENRNPFFLVYFSSVTHFPYSPPYPYYKTEGDPKYYGPSKYFRFVDPSDSRIPEESEREQIRAVYKESLLAFDSAVGKIVAELKKKGLYDNTLILLTSDHGESLFEDVHSHGHGEHLRGEGVTKVPLILKYPKNFPVSDRSGTFSGITSSLDVLPTVLSVAGRKTDAGYPGRDLTTLPALHFWKDDRKVYSETGIWFSDRGNHFFQKGRIRYPNILELHSIDSSDRNTVAISDPYAKETISFAKHRMVQDGKRKFLYIPGPDGVQYECYDRIGDPWNRKPLPVHLCSDLKLELERILLGSGKWKKAGDYFLPVGN
ncbi:sulfatase [Leptospira fluminis]|uniref:Sulfatase n=1 Tax=Leptospira fluminis TaxID=2484979 RepID=A0A4R9GKT0_9LEPT|nr:sulfatase-like hydrolase/transferase [Leptospira fluminis]TGK15155.1 sulfatase [Leptospira fluminis]